LSPYFNCAGNRHVEPVAAIESFDEALRFSARPVECQHMVYWARIDVDLVGLVRIAADVGAMTDFDPVQHWPVRDNHGLPLVAICGTEGCLGGAYRRLKR
jgi:hypothetical protein